MKTKVYIDFDGTLYNSDNFYNGFIEICSKYNIEKELFIELFDVDEIVYGYLENKYDKGEESITY